ncbi:MAG: peroxiredoxin, partial [Psychrobacter sp.]
TPENWRVGEPVIVPPPKTAAAADARKAEGYEYTDWYFSKKTL